MPSQFHYQSCPHCGQRPSFKRLYLFTWVAQQWHCSSCGTGLKFDYTRRAYAALLGMVWVALIARFVMPHNHFWVCVVLSLPFCALLFVLDKVVIADPRGHRPHAKSDAPNVSAS